MSTRCLQSAAPSSSANEVSQPQQPYLVVLALLKGPAWGQQETNPTGRGIVLCWMSVLKELRAGDMEGCMGETEALAAVGKDVMV